MFWAPNAALLKRIKEVNTPPAPGPQQDPLENVFVDLEPVPQVKVQQLVPEAQLPFYATEGAAGADLFALLPTGSITLEPGDRTLVPTGLAIELPRGFEAQIRSRSGLAFNHGVVVLNAPATIDSDYRGELKVLLINHGLNNYTINSGDRIAQLLISPAPQAIFHPTTALTPSDRGPSGFGSTGN